MKKLLMTIPMIALILGSSTQIQTSQAGRGDGPLGQIALATVVALYLLTRESTDTKIARIDALKIDYDKKMRAYVSEIISLEDVEAFALRTEEFKKEIDAFDKRIFNSYCDIGAHEDLHFFDTKKRRLARKTISDLKQQWAADYRSARSKIEIMDQQLAALRTLTTAENTVS